MERGQIKVTRIKESLKRVVEEERRNYMLVICQLDCDGNQDERK